MHPVRNTITHMELPDADAVEVAMVQYETDTSTEAKRFSIHLQPILLKSDIFHEIARRADHTPQTASFVALQAGIEIGYRLRQLQQERPAAPPTRGT